MSELKIKLQRIHEIREHPNADRMELAIIGGSGGWQCCVQKGAHAAGDLVIYFPVDSILPSDLEAKIFGPDAKVKLSKGRVRTIKLRGAISQGLAVGLDTLKVPSTVYCGQDLTKWFGVTKWEPPAEGSPGTNARKATLRNTNPNFHKYTDVNHLRNYPDALVGETVVAFEKIHGTNFRAGYVPYVAYTRWEKLKHQVMGWLLGIKPRWQFVYGSHNVQLQQKPNRKTGFYHNKLDQGDPYTRIVEQYRLKNKLQPGEVIYGEIYGHGIQKNYAYGCEPGEIKMVVVDLKKGDRYVNASELLEWCYIVELDWAPILYNGPYDAQKLENACSGPSILCPKQKVREGIVVRPVTEAASHMGRMIFKMLNPDYLMAKDNTEHH